jgi:membrane protein
MHTPGTEPAPPPGLGAAAKEVAEHASALARLEVELASLELKQKLSKLGVGAGLAIGAVLLLLYAFGFGLAAGAAGLATQMSVWLALLIVTGILVAIAAVLLFVAKGMFEKGSPPMPEQAIAEAKLTQEALKRNGGPDA